EAQKFTSVVRLCIRHPERLLTEIKLNLGSFNSPTSFDGGFTADAIVPANPKELGNNDIEKMASTMREIRNALSHGRDQKSASVILPTTANFERLKPWVSLITLVAGEVLLYSEYA